MEKEALEEWVNNRLHDIAQQASTVKPDFFPERIHEFRTETKKLRAMMRLLGMESDKEPRLPKAFHKAYRAAGAIRDRQMQLQYVASDKRHTLPFFAIWLAHKTGEAARDWNHTYSGSAVTELEDYVSGLPMPQPQLHTLGRYLRDRQDTIREYMEHDPDDDALHEIRKLAKDMGYMAGFCKKNWPEAWIFVQPLERVLDRLSDKAGAYNDRRNRLEGLEQFQLEYSAELNTKMQEQVARAWQDWTASRAKARLALLAAIRHFSHRKIKI